MVEFVLVSTVAVVLAMSLAQLGLFLWERNALMGSLSEGARVAATEGRTVADGRRLATELLRRSAGGRVAGAVPIQGVETGGAVVLWAEGALPSFVPGVPGLPVDRHVLRVSNRIGIAEGDDPEVVEQQLCAAMPKEHWTRTSDTLILHGRRICRPSGPAKRRARTASHRTRTTDEIDAASGRWTRGARIASTMECANGSCDRLMMKSRSGTRRRSSR